MPLSYAELEQFYEGLVARARVEKAERLLPANPLRQHGLARLIAEARTQAARFVPPGALDWLPEAQGSFMGLAE